MSADVIGIGSAGSDKGEWARLADMEGDLRQVRGWLSVLWLMKEGTQWPGNDEIQGYSVTIEAALTGFRTGFPHSYRPEFIPA